jgi:outer membrane protein OmpA-like peptidoglycan-associated protein
VSRLGLRLHADEEHWIPLSDLMTGLMFLFLLIALAYMVAVEHQKNQPKNVALQYAQTRAALGGEIDKTFATDFARWGAQFDPNTLTVRFTNKQALFATGSAELQPRFKAILDRFFPRYLSVLTQPKYRDLISEVRIEGYTSSLWKPGASLDQSYIGNMQLSQDRTRSVLAYVMGLPATQPHKDWLMDVLTANGLSFSHLIRNPDGSEDAAASQRVEFRVRTNASAPIGQILAAQNLAPTVAATPSLPYPAWSAAMIGTSLRTLYPNVTTNCLGYLDGVAAKYAGGRGAQLHGWGYDTAANAPVERVLFADDRGIVRGAADGGGQRFDVPQTLPQVRSETTGWQGYVSVTSRPVQAWGIMRAPATVCRFPPASESGGESM